MNDIDDRERGSAEQAQGVGMREGWQTKALGELCEIELGKTPARANALYWDEKCETGNVWLSIADLLKAESNVIFDSKEYVSDKGATICKLVPKGTLLVSFKLTLGRLAFAGRDLFTNEAIAALTIFNENEISKEFLFYCLTFFDGVKAAENDVKLKGMTLNKAKLKVMPVSFPQLPEQQRIVALLDEAFAGLATAKANAERNLQNARALFESHLQSVFSQRGEGWVETSVKGIARPGKGSIRTGPFGSQLLHSEFVDEGIAVLGIDNAVANYFRWGKGRFITKEKYQQLERYTVHPGDVLITIMGTCGRCAVVPDDVPTAINTKHLCCITLDRDQCLPGYLHLYFLHAPQSQEYLAKFAKGAIMAGLNMGLIQDLPVYLPPLHIQAELIGIADEFREETQHLTRLYERKLAALEELKKSLLNQAFNGEL